MREIDSESFLAGVSFMLDKREQYTLTSGPDVTNFGGYQLALISEPENFAPSSKEHRARTKIAILHLAEAFLKSPAPSERAEHA